MPPTTKEFSEAIIPKGIPQPNFTSNFHGWKVKYGTIHIKKENLYKSTQDIANTIGDTLEGKLNARPSASEKIKCRIWYRWECL